jgi:hypothetical protein
MTWLLIAFFVFLAIGLYTLLRHYKPASDDAVENARKLRSKASTDANWLGATVERKNSEARAKLSDSLVAEITAQGTLVTAEAGVEVAVNNFTSQIALGRLQMEQQLLEQHAKTQMAFDVASSAEHLALGINKGELAVIEAASSVGLDKETYSEVQKAALLSEVNLKERWGEKKQDIDMIVMYGQQEWILQYLLLEHIIELIRKAELMTGNARSLMDRHIVSMTEVYDARQRLIQIKVRKDLGGSDEDSDS